MVDFVEQVIKLRGYSQEMDAKQYSLIHVKFSVPTETYAVSLIANCTLKFFLTSGNIVDLKYSFDAEREINSKQTSQISMIWRKTLLFSTNLRESYMQYLDNKKM